jgi:hypothetical protein
MNAYGKYPKHNMLYILHVQADGTFNGQTYRGYIHLLEMEKSTDESTSERTMYVGQPKEYQEQEAVRNIYSK